MTRSLRLFLAAAAPLLAMATSVAAQTAPQDPGESWGKPVRAGDSSELLRTVGDQLGMVRSNQLFWQQLNALEFTANGQWTDLEAGGEMRPVSKYTYQISIEIPAARLDIEGPDMERTVQVVRGDLDRAWNERRPGYPSGNSDAAAFREQLIWFWPHAFTRAAAYAEKGLCPDGSACEGLTTTIAEIDGAPVVTTTIDGVEYRGTIGKDGRPARIEARIDVPGRGEVDYAVSYANYRNGLGLGASGEEVGEGIRGLAASSDVGAARGEGILDKFHTGTYFPGEFTHTIDGETVADLVTTEGWPNAFVIFPDPDLLAAVQ